MALLPAVTITQYSRWRNSELEVEKGSPVVGVKISTVIGENM